MNIEELNRRHFLNSEIYMRIDQGLSSKLLKYENRIIHLELEIGRKNKKSPSAAAYMISKMWKKENPELQDAIACKVFILDTKTFPYKRTLQHLGVRPGYDECKGVFFK